MAVDAARSAWRVNALAVAGPSGDVRLVLRDPVRHPIAEPLGNDLGVVAERLGSLAHGPAAGVLEGKRQVPMVERDVRLDLALEELVHESVVEVEAGFVYRSAARRDDAGP